MPGTWQYNRNTEWIGRKKNQVCVCVSYSPKQIYALQMPKKIATKLLLKQYPVQEFATDFHAKKLANQSNLQFSLLEMEHHNLLLIATAYKFMQLKNIISKENTAGGGTT